MEAYRLYPYVLAGWTGLALLGCGDMSAANAFSSVAGDGGPDVDADAGEELTDGVLLLGINASGSPWDVRFCLRTRELGFEPSSVPEPHDGTMPRSNYTGIARGGGAVLTPLTRTMEGGFDVIAIDARVAQGRPDADCAALICRGATCLRENIDYVVLRPKDTTKLAVGRAYLLALEGCQPRLLDPAAASYAEGGHCGATYDPTTGNLTATVVPLGTVAKSSVRPRPPEAVHLVTREANRSVEVDRVVLGSREWGSTSVPYHGTAALGSTLVGGAPVPMDASLGELQEYKVLARFADAGDAGFSVSFAEGAQWRTRPSSVTSWVGESFPLLVFVADPEGTSSSPPRPVLLPISASRAPVYADASVQSSGDR